MHEALLQGPPESTAAILSPDAFPACSLSLKLVDYFKLKAKLTTSNIELSRKASNRSNQQKTSDVSSVIIQMEEIGHAKDESRGVWWWWWWWGGITGLGTVSR